MTSAFDLPAIAAPASQGPARLMVSSPLAEALARGLVVIQYRADNLRIISVFGRAAVSVAPRIGHVHVTLDDAQWHWVDASGELIIQGLMPGAAPRANRARRPRAPSDRQQDR